MSKERLTMTREFPFNQLIHNINLSVNYFYLTQCLQTIQWDMYISWHRNFVRRRTLEAAYKKFLSFFFSRRSPKLVYLFNYFGTLCVDPRRVPVQRCIFLDEVEIWSKFVSRAPTRRDRGGRMERNERKKEEHWERRDGQVEKERERITGRVQTDRVENSLFYKDGTGSMMVASDKTIKIWQFFSFTSRIW